MPKVDPRSPEELKYQAKLNKVNKQIQKLKGELMADRLDVALYWRKHYRIKLRLARHHRKACPKR